MMTKHPRGFDDHQGRVPIYVIAGGKSRRFGSDKARAEVNGVPLIVAVAESLSKVARYVTVVAREDDAYADLNLKTIGDVVKDRGPVGGLLTAIDHRGKGWLFVTACDWVGIRTEWISLLMEYRTQAAQAVVFRSEYLEPLFGLYHSSIREIVKRRIDSGKLAMHELLAEINTVTVPAPPEWKDAINFNRPPLR
jgi:molybdopterin-guanine dinucleotide biosynthesis protein A